MRLYCLRDKKIDQITRVDVFPSDLIAFREYTLQVEKFHAENTFIDVEDYEVVHLANLREDFTVEGVGLVITKEYILDEINQLPVLQQKLVQPLK